MKTIFEQKKRDVFFYGIFAVLAILFIGVFSKSSPLYETNTWVDANAFLTVGKGIIHGLVPYKDLFEQKGPILYFLHALSNLFTPGEFWTIAVFEVICFWVTLVALFEIGKLFVTRTIAFWSVLIYPVFFFTFDIFQTGDSAEEFVLPLLCISLYLVLRRLKEKRLFTNKEFLFFGICMGVALWTKFTLLGFWIGLCLAVGIYYLIEKKYIELLKIIGSALAGVLIITLPILIYFWMYDALYDLFHVYFVVNITAYPSNNVTGLYSIIYRITKIIIAIGTFSFINFGNTILIVIGVYQFCFTSTFLKEKKARIILLSCIFFTYFFAFFGGKAFYYYFQIVVPFTYLGIIAVFDYFKTKFIISVQDSKRKFFIPFVITITVFAILFLTNPVVKSSKVYNQQPNVRKEFAQIMHNTYENPTLLNYNTLDMGFYNAADILPINKHFEKQNIDETRYPENVSEQERLIREQLIDFVVIDYIEENDVDYTLLEENYVLVAEKMKGTSSHRLYQRKSGL